MVENIVEMCSRKKELSLHAVHACTSLCLLRLVKYSISHIPLLHTILGHSFTELGKNNKKERGGVSDRVGRGGQWRDRIQQTQVNRDR
jgi:hypothetical protein